MTDKIKERDVRLSLVAGSDLTPSDNTGARRGGGGGGDMLDRLEKRVEKLEADVSQVQLDLSVLTTRSETFATKSDIESLRTDHQTLRAESVVELSKLRSELSDKITAASAKTSADLNSFKGDLFWKIGIPFLLLLVGGFSGVIWAIFKAAALK